VAYRQNTQPIKKGLSMLSQHTPVATLPTRDLSKARMFYEDTLGFAPERESVAGVAYKSGDAMVFVYQSEYAGTNKATAVSFDVPMSAFDDEVAVLREKGVTFMTFDAEGLEWNQGVASMTGEEMKSVWFSDPDGNVINVSAGEM
jgi:catechol 2,3-dioxygenase-like lactoylglutathione lyase family enzyme